MKILCSSDEQRVKCSRKQLLIIFSKGEYAEEQERHKAGSMTNHYGTRNHVI